MSLRIASHARRNTIVHQLNVPRALVYAVMEDVDLNCLEYRTIRKKAQKKSVTSEGAYWVVSFADHDKHRVFQNRTFLVVICCCLDTASRKLVLIKVWDSNSSYYLVARLSFHYLYESKLLPH